ncbi:MAG: FGGY-family carbohydrate kinase, partial [Armatimonadota bacterium]|nr:FGGY-family carbohydrate kinase [Armatimonadota bacterium]
VGDIFQWFVRTSRLTFQELEAEAGRLGPGESGALALDWWNGCRTPLVDADLSGLLVGLTLATEPAHIYRALLESTAFGTRRVIETFEAGGVAVREVHACGGLAERSPLLLQITADVLDREVLAAPLRHASAVGAAIYAAAAAGEEAGGYAGVVEATERMGSRSRIRYAPRPAGREIYEALYRHYLELARHFGEGGTEVMKALRRLRSRSEHRAGQRERR